MEEFDYKDWPSKKKLASPDQRFLVGEERKRIGFPAYLRELKKVMNGRSEDSMTEAESEFLLGQMVDLPDHPDEAPPGAEPIGRIGEDTRWHNLPSHDPQDLKVEVKFTSCDGPNCGAPIFFRTTPLGKKSPTNPDGTTHFGTCPDKDRFRNKNSRKKAEAKPA